MKKKNAKIELANKLNREYNFIYTRFNHCNAYISSVIQDIDTHNAYRLIKSYNTIVALIDIDNCKIYEFGKYSTTTSKQITQIHRQKFKNCERVFINETNW